MACPLVLLIEMLFYVGYRICNLSKEVLVKLDNVTLDQIEDASRVLSITPFELLNALLGFTGDGHKIHS